MSDEPVVYRGAGAPLLPGPVSDETAEWFANKLKGETPMSDQDELRARMVHVLNRVDDDAAARDDGMDVADTRELAQAIIDEFGLTVHGDDCGYHEIHGSYDTRFEARQ